MDLSVANQISVLLQAVSGERNCILLPLGSVIVGVNFVRTSQLELGRPLIHSVG